MKMYDLFIEEEVTINTIHQLKNQIAEKEQQKENKEFDLWVTTDFKKLKLTNSDQRNSFVKSELSIIVNEISNLKNDLKYSENYLKLIRNKQKFMLEFHLEELQDLPDE